MIAGRGVALSAFVEVIGIAVFWFAVHARLRMKERISGKKNSLEVISDLSAKYQQLIEEKGAPKWPLLVWRVCMPVGLCIALGAVFLSR